MYGGGFVGVTGDVAAGGASGNRASSDVAAVHGGAGDGPGADPRGATDGLGAFPDAGRRRRPGPGSRRGRRHLERGGLWSGCAPLPCCEICGGGSGPPPNYYIEAGFRVLSRGKDSLTPAVTFMRENGNFYSVPGPADLASGLSFRSIDPGISPGMLGSIGHYLGHDSNDRDEFIEFDYWGLNRWHRDVRVVQRGLRLLYEQQRHGLFTQPLQ